MFFFLVLFTFPKIYCAGSSHDYLSIASDEKDLQEQGISQISIVVCNLYPFTSTISKPGCTLADAVEEIDIGGVTLLRAAAKNHQRVSVLSDPADYKNH